MTDVGVAYLDIAPRLIKDFSSKLEGQIGSSTSKITKNTAKVGAALTAGITLPLAGLATTAVKSFENYDSALKQFAASTGVHGKRLEAVGKIMRGIFTTTVFDYPAIEKALAAVSQRFDVTGPAADKLTRKFLALGKVTGEDVPSLIESSTKALHAFNVPAERAGDMLDYIFKVSQQTGTPFATITAGVQALQVQLKALGLNSRESIALVAQLTAAGVSPSALKGATSGLSHFLSTSATAAQQANPFQAIQQTFQQIKNAPNFRSALAIAQPVFGARAGGALVNPIRQGQLDTSDLIATAGKSDATPEKAAKGLQTFADSLTILQHKISAALQPLGRTLVTMFKSLMPIFKNLIGYVKDAAKWFQHLSPQGQRLVVIIGLLAAALGPVLIVLAGFAASVAAISAPVLIAVVAIAALVGGFVWLYTHGGPLVAILGALGVAALAFGLSLGPIAFTIGTLELPLIAVVAAFLAVGAGIAFVVKHFAGVRHAFGTIKVVIGKAISAVIGGIIWLVKIFSKGIHTMLDMASHLPFVGGKFADLRDKFDKFSNHTIDGLKEQQKRFGGWKNDVIGDIAEVTGTIAVATTTFHSFNKQVKAGLAQAARGEGITTVLRPELFKKDQRRRRKKWSGSSHTGLAAGGPTLSGESYLVGEYEPEILTMGSQGGRVSNFGKGGGHTTNHFHIKSHDPHGVAREVHKIINEREGRNADHGKWHDRKFVG